jgi:hypothetical protein
MQIQLSTYNNTGAIRKPLIVAEGFNASCVMSMENTDIATFLEANDDDSVSLSYGRINVPYPGGMTLLDRIDMAQLTVQFGNMVQGGSSRFSFLSMEIDSKRIFPSGIFLKSDASVSLIKSSLFRFRNGSHVRFSAMRATRSMAQGLIV